MWIKFCGMVREEDVISACDLGVNAVGFILVPSSPRAIGVDDVRHLCQHVHNHCKTVAVFQNPDMNEIREIIKDIDIDFLQFHGCESAEEIEALQHPYIKAFRIDSDFDVRLFLPFRSAYAWLLDSTQNGPPVSVELFQRATDLHPDGRVILAGGLTTENLRSRLDEYRPYGIDVARGIEQHPRAKDFNEMREFIRVCHNYK